MATSTASTASTASTILPVETRQWILKARPKGKFETEEHLELQTIPIFPNHIGLDPNLLHNKILISLTHIQVDPTNILWITGSLAVNSERLYVPPTEVGKPLMSGAIGVITASWNPQYKAEDRVFGYFTLSEYVLLDPEEDKISMGIPLQKLPKGIDEGTFLAMGRTALTAYYGLFLTAQASLDKIKTAVVSGAAGGVGTAVVQMLKRIVGVDRVIAIVGTDEKCRFCLRELGADIALNYKAPSFRVDFVSATPDYVDLYWDNVAGDILDLNVRRIARFGKVIANGGISGYMEEENPPALSLAAYQTLFYQNASILGISITAFYGQGEEVVNKATEKLYQWAREGRYKPYKYEIEVPFEDVPVGLHILFRGENIGRTVLKLKSGAPGERVRSASGPEVVYK